uniref:Uncharacterized protein n=1 Tax=Chromera velia CCMP2878 TaxID=1169474 RepID=A0A0G4FV83_9ALVE|mmetsp:Transcript_6330/g.12558  ORF Transcript_6330/g.12558 Transcript_6330/m.12558 type:complete len:148 (-) Transcript_6330:554-997(-)|eukprot:Cvel_481.t1-p1 / transcript=Cvel_481.t1 / gene=Cvel_481 / organism=Chromera_velia_CCMP2878 / gene_product=hypothetical protein / transcript_product=hypothetical protein / location=Cvel_scaffold15:80425-81533(-) / protein_length=147 / sequence_SO=supercontig / SO=protein_coding / is_pseudo=false
MTEVLQTTGESAPLTVTVAPTEANDDLGKSEFPAGEDDENEEGDGEEEGEEADAGPTEPPVEVDPLSEEYKSRELGISGARKEWEVSLDEKQKKVKLGKGAKGGKKKKGGDFFINIELFPECFTLLPEIVVKPAPKKKGGKGGKKKK